MQWCIETGLRVKIWWFVKRARAIKRQLNLSHLIKFSNGWLEKFKKRHRTSNEIVHQQHSLPADKVTVTRKFHWFIQRNTERVGNWSTIANMDQTPMPFIFGGGKTYSTKGKNTITIFYLFIFTIQILLFCLILRLISMVESYRYQTKFLKLSE